MQSDLIFTTKGRYSGKGVLYVILFLISLFIGLPIWIVFMFPLLILYIPVLIWSFVSMILALSADGKMKNSFVELHTSYITGISTGNQAFQMRYNQVLQTQKGNNVIIIFCQSGRIEVQAKGVEQQVVSLIEQQKLKINQQKENLGQA